MITEDFRMSFGMVGFLVWAVGGEEGGGVEEGSGANLLTTIVDICVKADL